MWTSVGSLTAARTVLTVLVLLSSAQAGLSLRHAGLPSLLRSMDSRTSVADVAAEHLEEGARAGRSNFTSAGMAVSLYRGFEGSAGEQCEVQRQYVAQPVHCAQQNDRFSDVELKASLVQFQRLWAVMELTFPHSRCCMGLNHRFAIYHTIRALKPAIIIESGVAAGHTTWLIRQAAGPNTPIFALDPADPAATYPQSTGIGFWKDIPGSLTRYLTGRNFQDLAFARWDLLIPDPRVRARTLVILDDHQSSVQRLKMLHRWNFQYAFYEDNYPFSVATSADKWTCAGLAGLVHDYTSVLYGDAYSPNTVCSAVPNGTTRVLYKDQFGSRCQWLTLAEHAKNSEWMTANLASYFEFPPVFSPCTGTARRPLLGSDVSVLKPLGFPSLDAELWHYGHLYPALIQLNRVPLADQAQQVLDAIAASKAFAKDQREHNGWIR